MCVRAICPGPSVQLIFKSSNPEIFWSKTVSWLTSTSCENMILVKHTSSTACYFVCYFHFLLFARSWQWQLSVRGKNKKEKLEDFFKNVVKSADGVLVAGVKVSHADVMWLSCGFSDDAVENDLPVLGWSSCIVLNPFIKNHIYYASYKNWLFLDDSFLYYSCGF